MAGVPAGAPSDQRADREVVVGAPQSDDDDRRGVSTERGGTAGRVMPEGAMGNARSHRHGCCRCKALFQGAMFVLAQEAGR